MSETRTGLIGEMCAGAAILSQNWAYAQAPQDKFDGVAISNTDNTMLRIQVKASSFILQKGKRTPCYHFQLGSGSKNKKKPNNTKDWSTMTSWLYVALNTVTAYSFTSVKSTSSAKGCRGTILLRKTKQTLGRLLSKLRGK